MNTDFKVGDLVRRKPVSKKLTNSPYTALQESNDLVLVVNSLPASKRFFYGNVCGTGDTHLWSVDQFYLVSKGCL